MKKTIKLTTLSFRIRKNYNEALKFVKDDYRRYCALMLDVTDCEIWADAFTDVNSYNDYHSKDIVKLLNIDCYLCDHEDFKRYTIEEAINKLNESGWEVLDCERRKA